MPSKLKQQKVNFQPEDHAKMKAIAENRGVSVAELIRSVMGATIQNAPKPTVKRIHKVADEEMIRLYKNMTNNINQIAIYANRKKALDGVIYDALITIQKDLKALL